MLKNAVVDEARTQGKDWREILVMAKNRARWRRFVDALAPLWSKGEDDETRGTCGEIQFNQVGTISKCIFLNHNQKGKIVPYYKTLNCFIK